MHRRKYLSAISLAAGAGLAGCSGETGGNSSSGGGGNSSGGGSESTEASGGGEATEMSTSGSEEMGTDAGMGTEAGGTSAATATEKETMVTSTVQPSTSASMGGGGSGNTEVTESELNVEEGEYSTDIYMTGLIENTGDGVLRIPEARVSFYDNNDSILESSTETIAFLKPGTQWAINVPYLDDGEPARGEIESTSTETFQTELGVPDRLEITSQELQTGEEPSLSVAVKNTSNSEVAPAVFCVFYDGDGIAMGDGLDSLDQLPPGETWQTSLDFFGYSTQDATQISDYDLYANIT